MRPYLRPNVRQREVLTAIVEAGSVKLAAERLGLTYAAAHGQVQAAKHRVGAASLEQVIYLGARDGWLEPRDLRLKFTVDLADGVAAGV